ncbi:MAG: aminomethyl-transferring glycine dehydrogenase [Actinomycetes bacterium]
MSFTQHTLDQLEGHDDFLARHIGPNIGDQQAMLSVLGVDSLAALIERVVPDSIRSTDKLALPDAVNEVETLKRLQDLASRNRVLTSLIGMGYSNTVTPGVILRNIMENPAWYTAYTPYQPEISQGRLEALVNFQTMVCDLTGMELANASLLDEATAAAEAMAMCRRINPKQGNVFVVDPECHPQTVDVIRTRAVPIGIDVIVGDPEDLPEGCFGVLIQYPGTSGLLRDHRTAISAAHEAGALVTVATDLLALVLVRPPGEIGADIVVGSSQRFGVPLGFGGPHAAFIATSDAHKRTLPGRLVGVSLDAAGRTAYRLTLQTREQHIRREKATSNICTAQVLLAVMAGMYAAYHGPEGLQRIAARVHRLTTILAAGLTAASIEVETPTFFDTITVRVPGRANQVCATAVSLGVNLRLVDDDTIGISLDETSTRQVIETVWKAFGTSGVIADIEPSAVSAIPDELQRSSDFLTHETFNRYHSETEMLRYIRRLSDRDIALDRSMIPLGSCTMKLNATTEMLPVTWPEFGAIHPFVPLDQVEGYLELIHGLEAMLVEITGYAAVSLQPNAGSQGEFAGLLAIQAYHRSRGELQRRICLIPASAHGTNAASAVMAGLDVVVVACDADGNVDIDDLQSKIIESDNALSCLMVTYPSTHGVFEAAITDMCALVHAKGGQVYLDGANFNALVGVARPGRFGADVSHLNLHKTFCIPHGGGGPGVGPVAVGAHLAPFLPNHPLQREAGPDSGPGAIAAAPWGSASILPISWAYITMMGNQGLLAATQVAILNANYIVARLGSYFPVMHTGQHDTVAHECILDLREITRDTGVTVDDVAKRLIDYGFHAPTMSFPVPGTLMIEATESESKSEIDRFCEAMIAIRSEIDDIASGHVDVAQSALRHAPHTAEDLLSDHWGRPYTRQDAAYPVASVRAAKYFPPVSRIDGAYGDRNVFCSCPPLEAFA